MVIFWQDKAAAKHFSFSVRCLASNLLFFKRSSLEVFFIKIKNILVVWERGVQKQAAKIRGNLKTKGLQCLNCRVQSKTGIDESFAGSQI